jgi:hypothetical protein
MFIFNWLFDKLGYMPKVTVQVGMVEIKSLSEDPKPFTRPVKKPAVKRTTTRKVKK